MTKRMIGIVAVVLGVVAVGAVMALRPAAAVAQVRRPGLTGSGSLTVSFGMATPAPSKMKSHRKGPRHEL